MKKKIKMRNHKGHSFYTKLCAYMLTFAVAGTAMPALPVQAKTDKEQEAKENEEAEVESIRISSAEELEKFAAKCHVDEWSRNKVVTLTADIDLTNSDFVNIPVFSGTFNGSGHKISNYRYSADGYITGFFRYIQEGAVVENLELYGNVSCADEKECVGALCGINKGTIRNCSFQGAVSGKNETGGIVGINEGTGLIQHCSTKGTVTGYYYTGGIVGKNYGTVDNCTNDSNVNNNSTWVEEDDEINTEILQNIKENETDLKLASGVDTGGIAGFSKGVIIRCTNSGKIGYEHTGYNIGGIAGRQSGIITLCTNRGSVYGRKDVGGIIGQMEPYIELNAAESIREAVNKLHDLIQKTLDDMEKGKNVIKGDVDTLKNYSDAVIDHSDALGDKLTDFADRNMDEVNTLTDRVDNVFDMIPAVMDCMKLAGNSMTDLNHALKKVNEDFNISDKMSSELYHETDYHRLSVISSVGGSLSVDNQNPDEGAVVTITVQPDNGYDLNGLNVADALGKGVATTQTGNRTYTFVMPKENVQVSAVYSYTGAFLASSNEGGRITVTNQDNGMSEMKAEAYNGYELIGNQIFIGNQSVTLTDDKASVNRAAYLSGNQPIIVSGTFQKKANTHKVIPVSGTGGTVTVENQVAAAGDMVTVHVVTSYRYSLSSLTYSDGSNDVSFINNTTSNAGEYTFTMPNADSTVKAVFQYSGTDADTVVYTESSVGGNVTAVRSMESGDEYYITITPASGYVIPEADALEIYADNSVVASATLGKADLTEQGEAYRYLLNTNAYTAPIRVWGHFTKSPAAKDITCTSGTGGVISAGSSSAEAGDTVYLASATRSGYRLKTLSVKTVSGTVVPYQTEAKRYKFTMPSEDVEVMAVYEPIQLIVTSNAGGGASYTGGNDTKVTLTVTPDSGYTVSTNPTVKDKTGKTLALGKAAAGTWAYEFYLDSASQPGTAQINFQKQTQENATQDALDRINANAGTLNGKSNDISLKIDKIRALITDEDGNVKQWSELNDAQRTELLNNVSDLMDDMTQAGTAASEILSDLALIASIEAPYIKEAAGKVGDDLNTATNHVQSVINNLQNAAAGVRAIVDYLNGQPELNFSKLGEEFDRNLDNLHDQLKGMTNTIQSISDHASEYSDVVNHDLEAVNDQLNVVFNLFVDKVEKLDDNDIGSMFADVSDEEIETATTGRVDDSRNKGIVEGDINVGGIAGSMAIDEEDPEDNAAGSMDFSLGDTYKTKCIINNSTNEGYVSSKKDGAGGIAGYMKFGVITDCKAYGSVESDQGDYIGGVCGQSLALIRRSYSLCTISGNHNVGGIAGFGTTITDCYSMVNITDAAGRYGAIAGQIAMNDEEEQETENITHNFYVGDDIYGIDNISYIGVAEPITYEELLAVEGMPTDFWHLQVTFKIDDTYLGTQELAYGDSLSKLVFPDVPAKENCYGVWPDVSDKIMTGNLVIEGEYKDNVTIVQSEASSVSTLQSDEKERKKPIALIEGVFTEEALLHASISDKIPPADVAGEKDYVIYEIALENTDTASTEALSVRLLNPYKKACIWSYRNGKWVQAECKVRGQYLQTTLNGTEGVFCIVEETTSVTMILMIAVCVIAGILLIVMIKKLAEKRKQKKAKKPKKEKKKKAKKQEPEKVE